MEGKGTGFLLILSSRSFQEGLKLSRRGFPLHWARGRLGSILQAYGYPKRYQLLQQNEHNLPLSWLLFPSLQVHLSPPCFKSSKTWTSDRCLSSVQVASDSAHGNDPVQVLRLSIAPILIFIKYKVYKPTTLTATKRRSTDRASDSTLRSEWTSVKVFS